MTMIEKLARAMDASMAEGGNVTPETYEALLRQTALAALRALREPTRRMIKAGASGSGEDSESVAEGTWQAMIDTAIKEAEA